MLSSIVITKLIAVADCFFVNICFMTIFFLKTNFADKNTMGKGEVYGLRKWGDEMD